MSTISRRRKKQEMELTRIQRFAKALCMAWCNNCVMADDNKEVCTSRNCSVYPIAAATLGRLDARDSFIHKRESESEPDGH